MPKAMSKADGIVPLFACTKCNSRHPFEELSQGHQLCRNCRSSHQMIKCNYCRSEFQQESGSTSKSSICKKCEQLQAQHGKPGPCAFCNIIAAFIGTKCQRCTNSEKKYGPPMACEHCRQKCAFDRKDPESKKKVDGKLLCWLCTMAFKRTLAKARQKEAMLKGSSSGSASHHRSSGGDSKSYSSSSNRHHHHNHGSHRHNTGSSTNASTGNTSSSYQRSSSHRSSSHRDSSSSLPSSHKKQRIESSNGHLSSSMSSLSSSMNDTRFVDPNNSDLATVVAQLKDQVALLNKRIQMKEKELLSKDQQIADLKSTNTREQRELREKINMMQKQHTEKISEMQTKLVTMQKQIVSQSKASKASVATTSGYVEPPLVI